MSKCQPVPLYVVSKGRHEYMVTSKALTAMGVDHSVVVEPSQAKDYRQAINRFRLRADVVEMDMKYKECYELCDEHGLSKSTGPGPARNFAWDHSIEQGYDRHWVMDDNIKGFYRYNKNLKVPCKSPLFWKAMEDFTGRYSNVLMAGPNYFMFVSRKSKMPPFVCNTRIYSCNLIRNDAQFRWRGRYNEDTILSLDILKAGWCTLQFNVFLQDKMLTQVLPGGNATEFYYVEGKVGDTRYAVNGTLAKSQMQVKVHPDVSRLVWKWRRWHHQVDYKKFKRNKLIRNPDIEIQPGTNNYGMELVMKDMGLEPKLTT